MQLLAWGILGNAAAAIEPCPDGCVQAGLLQLLLDAAAYVVPVSGRGSSSSAEWLSRLSPEQLSASKQSAWSTLQQVSSNRNCPYTHPTGGYSHMLPTLIPDNKLGVRSQVA